MMVHSEEQDDPFSFQTQVFLSWLQDHGATIHSNIRVADLRAKNAGRGVVATRSILEDEELFAIPRSLILTAESSSLPAHVRSTLRDPWSSLIAAMITEFDKASESAWKPYLDLLPESFDTLMYWNDAELQLLQGSAVKDKIGKQKADTIFEGQVIPFVAPSLHSLEKAQLLSLCHRMGSAIMAYGFDLEEPREDPEARDRNVEDDWEEDQDDDEGLNKGMIPMADLLNADADRNNAKLFYEDDKVVMKAIKQIQAGEEIFNDYGPLPTADLVRRYGYATEHYAVYDVVEVDRELIQSMAKSSNKLSDDAIGARTDYLDEQGVLDDGYDIGHRGETQFPEELCILLNILTISEVDFEKLKRKGKLPKPDLSHDAQRLLYSVLVCRRAFYPTNGLSQASTDASASRRGMATAIITGELTILQEAADVIAEMHQGSSKRKAETFEEDVKTFRDGSKKST